MSSGTYHPADSTGAQIAEGVGWGIGWGTAGGFAGGYGGAFISSFEVWEAEAIAEEAITEAGETWIEGAGDTWIEGLEGAGQDTWIEDIGMGDTWP
jgi:hypothetical protein